MSVPSSEVYITGRLDNTFLRRIKNMLPDAITRAIYQTREDMKLYLTDPSIIPYHREGYPGTSRQPGTLQKSVQAFISPGQLVFRWSAIDPFTGYDYAKIRDLLGGKEAPAGWSKKILDIAKQILRANLITELQRLQP